MTKQERIIKFLKIIFHKKFLPFWFFIIFTGITGFVILHENHMVRSREISFNQFVLKNFNNNSTNEIKPLSIESTRAFFFIAQTLKSFGFLRCDQYLPDPDCSSGLVNDQKSFHELRDAVLQTQTGFQKAPANPPYHTLKTLMINFGVNPGDDKSKYIGVMLYTGIDAGYRIMKILNLFRSGVSDKPCKRPLYLKWFFMEDMHSFEALRNDYDFVIADSQIPVYVFQKDSANRWKFSSSQSEGLAKYIKSDDKSLKDPLWCE
jgi:hypothetical protein